MSKMKTWRCPKCDHEVQAIAIAVSHRCKYNKNIETAYKEIEEKK